MYNRNVLVIAYYFPPMGLSGVQRTLKFCKYLPESGWKPIVLTTSSDAFYAFDETLNQELEDKDILVYRTDGATSNRLRIKKKKLLKFPSYFMQKIGRMFLSTIYQPDSRINWKKKALTTAEEIIKEHSIHAIFATAPPFTDFLIAREISAKYGIPFVVDYRDVWVDNPFHYYITPFHKLRNINMERDILTHAKKAIVTTRHTKELIVKRYKFISHEDVVIIPHGWDPEDFTGMFKYKPDPKKFTITHSGLFQDNRTPKYFFKALSNFIKKNAEAGNNIEARFIGLMRPRHNKYIKKYGLQKNVVSLGYISHKESIRNLMESDVLWLMLNDTVRSPGKLYEYFGTRKPLLVCAPEGIIRRTSMESKAAITTGPKDVAAIEEAIAAYYNLWKKGNLPKVDEDFAQNFNRQKLTADLARELALAAEF